MLIERFTDGTFRSWTPTTLEALGLDEKVLEDAIAQNPSLLGFDSRRSGISGDFKSFTQVTLRTPTKRTIYADVVFFTASGHIIIVEVKRYGNPELRDRAVIAQVIDYASTIQSLGEIELCNAFASSSDQTWTELTNTWFPLENDPEDLALLLHQRMRTGQINLVIACDRIPTGLFDVARGVSTQSAVGFELDLVEIRPFSLNDSTDSSVLFLPHNRWSTETVARTVVTVEFEAGTPKPEVKVVTTAAEEISENFQVAKGALRHFSEEEVKAEVLELGAPVLLSLLEFCSAESFGNKIVAKGKKQKGSFGFYIPWMDSTGQTSRQMAFSVTYGKTSEVYWFFQKLKELSKCYPEFAKRFTDIFGTAIDPMGKETRQPIEAIGKKMAEFKELMIWFRDNTARS